MSEFGERMAPFLAMAEPRISAQPKSKYHKFILRHIKQSFMCAFVHLFALPYPKLLGV